MQALSSKMGVKQIFDIQIVDKKDLFCFKINAHLWILIMIEIDSKGTPDEKVEEPNEMELDASVIVWIHLSSDKTGQIHFGYSLINPHLSW